MMISTYQIRNVLRIYGNQLKRRSHSNVTEPGQKPSDFVEISAEARRKQVLNQLSKKLISGLIPKGKERELAEEGEIEDFASFLGREAESV